MTKQTKPQADAIALDCSPPLRGVVIASRENAHPWSGPNEGWVTEVWHTESHLKSQRIADCLPSLWLVWLVANTEQPSLVVYRHVCEKCSRDHVVENSCECLRGLRRWDSEKRAWKW